MNPMHLAFDIGGESGRAVIGRLEEGRLHFEVVHRFPNRPVRTPDGLQWDILSLWAEILEGITLAVRRHPDAIATIGIDTWGSTFALCDTQGALLANPLHYRDSRTDGLQPLADAIVPRAEVYAITGNQFMRQNALLHLFALAQAQSPLLQVAGSLLMIPDLFNYWLTGRQCIEFSGASTTQFYNPTTNAWAPELLERFGIPTRILPEIVPPGIVLGPVAPWVQGLCGCGPIPVVTVVSHDTGAAVAATPNTGNRFAYISSGTWSLVGAEIERPKITPQGLALSITNEGGIDGSFRFLKNVMGLWLVQEARRTWAAQGYNYTYADLVSLAAAETPLRAIVDPDDPLFFEPGDMPARVAAYCARTGQPVPERVGAVVRCLLDSLALKYRWVVEGIEQILGYRLAPMHILGGGAQNGLLNQNTANALQRTVLAGPIEATAIGNLVVQMIASGRLRDRIEARALIAASSDTAHYEPADRAQWDDAYARLLALLPKPQRV